MADSLAGVVLAAGAGTRLRPLTWLRPKALCPVGGTPLVDRALVQVSELTSSVAVNVHHGRDALVAHLDGRVHLSLEEPEALGTAGALGQLRGWIDERATVVVNADTWRAAGLDRFADGWDGERLRLAVVEDAMRGDFGRWRYVGAALLPWASVRDLPSTPSGLYEVSWRAAAERGALDLFPVEGTVVPCDTPADYLRANLVASGGEPVIGAGAVVDGTVERSVVWDGAVVRPGEALRDAIRTDGGITVLVR